MGTDPSLVFLDADVLARPVTRTLLLVGSDAAGLRVTWSAYVEEQANRHLPSRATPLTVVRSILGRELSAAGNEPERFSGTSASDRQVLCDVEAAGAGFLVTSDVDDFAECDLIELSVSAVNPDLFMAIRLPDDAYLHALRQLVSNLKNAPRSVEQMHSLIARQHPRLFARHADRFGVEPAPSDYREPRTLFRGARCVRCGAAVFTKTGATVGFGPQCPRCV